MQAGFDAVELGVYTGERFGVAGAEITAAGLFRDLAQRVERMAYEGKLLPVERMVIHTANPDGRRWLVDPGGFGTVEQRAPPRASLTRLRVGKV